MPLGHLSWAGNPDPELRLQGLLGPTSLLDRRVDMFLHLLYSLLL